MSSVIAQRLRDQLLRAVFIPSDYQAPPIYFSLTRKIPESNASGSQLDEPSGFNYARRQYGLGSTFWVPSGFGEVTNRSEIRFNEASGTWGTIVGWAMTDALTGGRVLACGQVQRPLKVTSGGIMVIPPSGVTISIQDA